MNGDQRGASLQFDDAEVAALRTIAGDWLNEQIVAPPYSTAVTSVLRKLGVAAEDADPTPTAVILETADRPVQLDNARS